MHMVDGGTALCVPGNHENKLGRALKGRKVKLTHGLAETLEQLRRSRRSSATQVAAFIDGLVSHVVLDGGRLVVAHAGLTEAMHGPRSGAVRSFALYGETTGETDEFGLPVRYHWAADYRGRAAVVYGHTPVPSASGSTARSASTPVASSAAADGAALARARTGVGAGRAVYYEPPARCRAEAPG